MGNRVVTYVHRPKRPRQKKARAAAQAGPAVVTRAAAERGHNPANSVDGKETSPEIKAFFARMVRRGGALPPDTSK